MIDTHGKRIELKDIADLVDRFETVLEAKNISIPRNEATSADMLPVWRILLRLREGLIPSPDDMRSEYAAAIAVHDLAAKVVANEGHADFEMLVPHLKMLEAGAVHITQPPPSDADVYNKLIEMYWACLLLENGVSVKLDHPKHSPGDNPDVIALDAGEPARAYAFKTVRSPHTENLREHLVKGVSQIERSGAKEGIVAFHLTPRIFNLDFWAQGKCWADWRVPAARACIAMQSWIAQLVIDNGQTAIDGIFAGNKTTGTVLCLAIFPIVARNPVNGNSIVMPLKVALLVDLSPSKPLSPALHSEIEAANRSMQERLL